ncbi:MAG: glycosyltransferase family 9 protein [Deltaproteobacteria bacterium]|nr:glycosyltransferase family 9 protein [Deltaproteobacteria bacterium]
MIFHRMRSLLKKSLLSLRRGGLFLLVLCGAGRPKRKFPESPGRILVISQQRLGDAVLSLPCVSVLRGRFPGARILVLCPPAVREIFDLCPGVDDVMVGTCRGGLTGIRRLVRSLRENEFDLVIDLNTDGLLFPAFLAGLAGSGYSVGYGQDGRGVFFDEVVPGPDGEKHTVDRLLALLVPLGVENPSREVRLDLPGNATEPFRPGHPVGRKNEGIPLVGVHPGGTHWTQRWPVEYFAELSDLLIEKGSARVVLCGGPSDWEILRRVQERMRMRPEVAPPFPSLRDFAVFLSRLDLLICNNSGPLHLACAVGTKTFSFMGPTKAVQWWPQGMEHHVFRMNDLPCIGCNRGWCRVKTHDCMRGILPDEVFRAFRKAFRQTAVPGPAAVHPL